MAMGDSSLSWPMEFICPISRSVMADPVIVRSGQTYERRCIEAWMDLGQNCCVKHSVPLDRNFIISNTGLKAAIISMAKSNGMLTPPLPPSPERAYALARQLIQELTQRSSKLQEPSLPDLEPEDESGVDERKDEHGSQVHADNLNGAQDEEQEQKAEAGDIYGGMESLNVEAERRGKYAQKDYPANTGERRGYNCVKSSSLCPAHGEISDVADERESHVKSSSTVPILNGPMESLGTSSPNRAEMHQMEKEKSGANLEQGFARYPRTDGSVTNPLMYSYSAPSTTLLDSGCGTNELPPHLATNPSSYSTSEDPHPHPPPSSSSSSADPLVQMLQNGGEDEQEAAVMELRQLTRTAENRLKLCRTEIIESLLPLFKSNNPNIQINAVAALVNLSIEKPNKVAIVRAGGVRFLVHVLNSGFPEAQEHAAGAAFSLALADENKNPMGILQTIPPLVQLIHTGPEGSHQDAAMALYHLSLLQANKTKLVKAGAVPILLDMAQSKEKPDMASRSLLILSNVASIPEGKTCLLQLDAIPILVKLLAIPGNKSSVATPEQAAAVLVLLSKGNVRFRAMASNAGAHELLTVLAENGTMCAQEKAAALLAIMKESASGPDELDGSAVLSRQYLRMRNDRGQMNSSAF